MRRAGTASHPAWIVGYPWGRFTTLLLGSVSHAVVLHARCPVVVIPAAAGERKPAVPR